MGVAAMGVGVYLFIELQQFPLAEEKATWLSPIFMTFGIVFCVVSFIGGAGAALRHKHLLGTVRLLFFFTGHPDRFRGVHHVIMVDCQYTYGEDSFLG